jgi:hypothetical protein
VDLRLADARGGRLDRVSDIRAGVEGAHVIQSRRFDDLLERAARIDRKADRAAADGQARDPFWSLPSKEKRSGRANVRADDVRNSQAPLRDRRYRPGTHLTTLFVEPAIGRIAHLICPDTLPGAIAVAALDPSLHSCQGCALTPWEGSAESGFPLPVRGTILG